MVQGITRMTRDLSPLMPMTTTPEPWKSQDRPTSPQENGCWSYRKRRRRLLDVHSRDGDIRTFVLQSRRRFYFNVDSAASYGICSCTCCASAHCRNYNLLGSKPARCQVRRLMFGTIFETLLLFILLAVGVESSAPTYSFCYSQMTRADSNGDSTIDSTEWEVFIGFVSGGTVSPTSLDKTALFSSVGGTDSFGIAAVQDSANNNAFCQSVYESILSSSSTQLDTSETRCLYAMSIGDADRDSALARLVEYPRYANQVSGNVFGFSISYDELPAEVQAVFDEFVDDTSADTINIVGAKSSETLSTEQASKLSLFCQHTAISILAASGSSDTPVSAPIAAPVPSSTTSSPIAAPVSAPTPVAATGTSIPVAAPVAVAAAPTTGVPDGFTPSFTSTVCLQQIAFSDSSRDNTLSSSEYYGFLNRLTDDAFSQYGSFESLPESLRTAFASLAGGSESGTVNVYGSKPGQTASQEDTDRLNQFCTVTDVAVQQGMTNGGGGSADNPVSSPTDAGNPTPAATSSLSYEDCTRTMIVADLSRDSLLNEKEFVRFLSRLDSTIQESDALSALPQSLQDLFTGLAVVNGEIDVTGSKPNETPTSEQKIHLESVCSQVGVALANLVNPSTSAPTALSTGKITIYNAFVISNSAQMTASTLKANQAEWDGMNLAYDLFVHNSITNFTNANRPSRKLSKSWKGLHIRRRLPLSGVAKDSPRIYVIDDVTCPETVSRGDFCHVAYASFDVEFVDMSQEKLSEVLTNFTQSLLDPYLEELLLLSNPNTVIRIAGLNGILRPPESGTPPPASQVSETSGDEVEGPNVVQIIGGIVIICILIGCPLYYWKTRHNKRKPKINKSNPIHDGNDIDEREPYGVESAPPYGSNSPFYNASKVIVDNEDDQSFDDEESNDPSEEQQEKTEGKKFKPFRLGKKKDFTVDDDIGILESNDGLPDGVDDFGNYEYEEPIETWEHNNIDNDWGDGQWAIATSGNQNSDNLFDTLAGNQKTKNDDENEETEWSGSLSESSGSNSALGNGSTISGASGNVGQLGGLVDNGQWNGVMQTAAQIENNLTGSVSSHNSDCPSQGSNKSMSETSYDREITSDFVDDPFDDRTHQTGASMTSEEQRRRDVYRAQIEDLVRKAAPDEIGNVKNMMDQFVGREAELINTLQTMLERSMSQSRLKAVHKSKAIRDRDTRELTSGGAESSAVIAAASMINGEDDLYDDDGDFEGDSYYDDNLDGSVAGSRSYDDGDMDDFDYDDEGDEKSYYDEGDEQSHDDERSYYSRNYDDEDGSRSRSVSYDDEEGSRSRSGSYDDDDGSRSRSGSYEDDDRSRSQSGSYDDDQEDSAYHSQAEPYDDDFEGSGSGSRTGSYNEKDGFDDIERSFTGSRSGSGSKERSYVYDDGDGSYYSDEG